MNYKKWGKIIFLILVAFVGVTVYFTTGLNELSIQEFQNWIQSFGALAAVVFIALYLILPIFLVPASILTLAAGALFGKGLGTLYVIIGANLGANAAFLFARYFGEGIQKKLANSKIKQLKRLDDKTEENGFLFVLYLRLVPLFPFSLLNYGLAFTEVKFKDYFFATLLGMIPATFAFVFLGEGFTNIGSTDFWIALILFLIVITVPTIIKKKYGAKPIKEPANST